MSAGTNTENIVKLFQYKFRRYAAQSGIPAADLDGVDPADFYAWCDENMSLLTKGEDLDKTGVSDEDWNQAKALAEDPAVVARMSQFWLAIVLSIRKPPVHTLDRMHIIYLLLYDDGTIYPLQSVVDRCVNLPNGKFDDALTMMVVSQNATSMLNTLIAQGVDGSHDAGDKYGGENEVEVFLGLIRSLLDGKLGGHDLPVKIKPELMPAMENYYRLVQGILHPLSADKIAAFQRRKAKLAREASANLPPGEGPRGGWSE